MSYIAKCEKRKKEKALDVAAGYYRLAFGCVSDAVSLLFLDENSLSKEQIESLDLFNVSEIKRQKGGGIEIKFFDRLKALQMLSQKCEADNSNGANSIYNAIEKSAAALSEAENE